MTPERADAVVVGARCAGSAAATALARAGRRVVALDRAHFPSDTLSTHLLFAGGVAELARLGALERVEATGAPRMPTALVAGDGEQVRAAYTPVDGIAFGLCVRRPGLDAALVETARAAGAEVRERCRVTELVRAEGGRVTGVRYRDAAGAERELHAPLAVGADGRRSLVARLAGVQEPYRSHANGRACFFAYYEDAAAPEWRGVAAQWRAGSELGTAFPCDGGLLLVLVMPPREAAAAILADLDAGYEATVAAIPGLRERLAGSVRASRVRSALDTTSYFRRSAGPGWALPGDAGHFKDPVTAQGIRDALRYGRRLGEVAAPVLDDAAALDRALAGWERERERDCLECYQWTNRVGRGERLGPLEVELYRRAAADPVRARELLDVFSRTRRPGEVFSARRGLALAAVALARRRGERRRVARDASGELAAALSGGLQRAGAALRARRA